jgi:hypothetical protein
VSTLPDHQVHIAKLSNPCHQSHQFAKCTLPNCQVHVINPHYQCHVAKSPSHQVHIVKLSSPCHQSTSSMPHCQVTFNLQVACQTIQNYESLRKNIHEISNSKFHYMFGWMDDLSFIHFCRTHFLDELIDFHEWNFMIF